MLSCSWCASAMPSEMPPPLPPPPPPRASRVASVETIEDMEDAWHVHPVRNSQAASRDQAGKQITRQASGAVRLLPLRVRLAS